MSCCCLLRDLEPALINCFVFWLLLYWLLSRFARRLLIWELSGPSVKFRWDIASEIYELFSFRDAFHGAIDRTGNGNHGGISVDHLLGILFEKFSYSRFHWLFSSFLDAFVIVRFCFLLNVLRNLTDWRYIGLLRFELTFVLGLFVDCSLGEWSILVIDSLLRGVKGLAFEIILCWFSFLSELKHKLRNLLQRATHQEIIILVPRFLNFFSPFLWTAWLKHEIEPIGEHYLIDLDITLQKLQSIKDPSLHHYLRKEFSRFLTLDALFLEHPHHFPNKFCLLELLPLRGIVERDILIHPYPAFLIFIDEDHLASNVKESKSVKEALKANKRLLDQIQHLMEGHFGERVEVGGEVLDGDLDDWTLIE